MDARKVTAAGMLGMMLALGCGDDGAGEPDAAPQTTDIGGWYRVDSQREGPCGMTQPGTNPPSHVWVESFGGLYYLRYCSGTAEADCYATPFYDFNEPIEGGWRAEGGSAFFSADCTLSWERTSATLSGEQLDVHALRYSTVRAVPQEECTLAAAAALTEPCSYEVGLVLTRL
jgi:hypothetical protein